MEDTYTHHITSVQYENVVLEKCWNEKRKKSNGN